MDKGDITLRQLVSEQGKKMDEIHSALVGNPQYGIKGMTQRLTDIEKTQSEHIDFFKHIKIMVKFGTPVISAVFIAIWEFIKSKLI